MRKYFLATAITLALLGQAAAQSSTTRSFYDGRGRNLVWTGQSWTRGTSPSCRDGRGRFSGRAIRHGNSTSFYGPRGKYLSINTGPRR